jgi:predicted N-acetyltransferase YhbS
MVRRAVAEACRLGHGAVVLVGDAPYYSRFGFTAEKTGDLKLPGLFERHRLLALELIPGALDGVRGLIRATGTPDIWVSVPQRRRVQARQGAHAA